MFVLTTVTRDCKNGDLYKSRPGKPTVLTVG